jgi:hypothetical protein
MEQRKGMRISKQNKQYLIGIAHMFSGFTLLAISKYLCGLIHMLNVGFGLGLIPLIILSIKGISIILEDNDDSK